MTAMAVEVDPPAGPVLARLTKARKAGKGWEAQCPAHDDHRASLSISLGTDGRVLLHCHAGCAPRDIVERIGLRMRDLFPPRQGSGRTAGKLGRIVAEYDYVDAEGTLLYQVVRYEPKNFKQRRPDGRGGWIWKMEGVERVLYHLPQLIAGIQQGRLVMVVEGEKDVATLERHGFIATTNAQGVGKWEKRFSEALRGAKVVLLPDQDDAGREHMLAIAASLQGVAADVRLLELQGLPPKGDITTWFGDGHTTDELRELVRLAPAVEHLGIRPPAPPEPTRREAETDETAFFKCTDIGNGERFVHHHGRDVLYVPAWSQWLVWDGRCWNRDRTREVERLAKATIRGIYDEARDCENKEVRAGILGWAKKSEANNRVMALLSRAQAEPGVAIVHDALDSDGWKLGVLNGTLDLTTGALKGHQRSDLITRLVSIQYDSEAQCPTWLKFLDRVLDKNQGLISFLQRAIGYSLTGITREQVLFFLHGVGANGKSTFLEVIRELLGTYATQADFATFLERKSDGPRNDVARLVGARLVTSSEVGEGKRLDEGLVKSLTGADTIAARMLYAEAFEFRPQFKLWLAANHKPVVRGTDDAIWRRVRLVPFTVQIPEAERDPDLLLALREELPGILAWAVQGCLDWQEYGLSAPDEVRLATEAYRRESDVLGAFLEAECALEDGSYELASTLYSAYREWATKGGEFVLSQTAFGRRLTERGITPEKRGPLNKVYRAGVRLLATDEPTEDRFL